MTEKVEVSQADRDAAAAFLGYRDWDDATDYRLTGKQDRDVERAVQAFARHRQAEREAVVRLTKALTAIAERAEKLRKGTDDWFELVEFEAVARQALATVESAE